MSAVVFGPGLVVGGGGGGGGAEDPGMPSTGLVADWRASALALDDGDPVASWAPSTGAGTLTSSGANRPTFRLTGSASGEPAVEFDGTDDYLKVLPITGLPDGADVGTVVVILSRAQPLGGGYGHIVHYGAPNAGEARGLAIHGPSETWRTHEWSGSQVAVSAPRDFGCHVLGHQYDGTDVSLWVDGVPTVTATTALNTGTAEVVFGSRLDGPTEHGAFRLMRVSVYDHALVDAEWAQVMSHARLAHGAR